MVALYNAADGDNWYANANWLTDAPLNEWHGVTTDEDGRVTRLDVEVNNLSGNIPPEIGKLVHLIRLFLRGNRLTGTVPLELGNLTRLEFLTLRRQQALG